MSFDPSTHLAAAFEAIGIAVTRADGRVFRGVLAAPDRDAFSGMARDTDYRLRHPMLADPLVVGDLLMIDGARYRVSEPSRAYGHGLQADTPLSRL